MQSAPIVILALINSVLVTLSQLALWQRKEYRIDRMVSYVNSPEGSLVRQYAPLGAGALLFLSWIAWFMSQYEIAEYIAIGSMLTLLVGHGIRSIRKGVMRPDWTWRAVAVLLLIFFSAIASASLMMQYGDELALMMATMLFFLPALVAVCVFSIAIPAQLQKHRAVYSARKLRERLYDLTVVGITGSVGKTSTKTYLLHLLGGESKKIQATNKHRNSPYAVACDMLASLSSQTQTYIAEMGAYTKGEIAELAQLTKPKIGVVTAITNQHAALFGSLAALAKTKWELVDSLPEDGIAVLNKADDQVVRQAKRTKKKIVWFSSEGDADISASNIVLRPDHTSCTISIAGEEKTTQLPIISRGQLVPVLAAIAVAHELGVSDTKIYDRLATLPSLPRTMERVSGKAGITVIDDSYSASEASVANAIEYLTSLPKGDVRLVLVPIIELGLEGHIVHERIGKLLSKTNLRVFVYGNAYASDIARGIGKKSSVNISWVTDAKKLVDVVSADITSSTTIALEGRVPALLREVLL